MKWHFNYTCLLFLIPLGIQTYAMKICCCMGLFYIDTWSGWVTEAIPDTNHCRKIGVSAHSPDMQTGWTGRKNGPVLSPPRTCPPTHTRGREKETDSPTPCMIWLGIFCRSAGSCLAICVLCPAHLSQKLPLPGQGAKLPAWVGPTQVGRLANNPLGNSPMAIMTSHLKMTEVCSSLQISSAHHSWGKQQYRSPNSSFRWQETFQSSYSSNKWCHFQLCGATFSYVSYFYNFQLCYFPKWGQWV